MGTIKKVNDINSRKFHPDMFMRSAEYLSDYTIRVVFFDGSVKDCDLYPLITNTNSMSFVRKFLNKKKFKDFKLGGRGADLSWGDGTIFEVYWEYLYQHGKRVRQSKKVLSGNKHSK